MQILEIQTWGPLQKLSRSRILVSFIRRQGHAGSSTQTCHSFALCSAAAASAAAAFRSATIVIVAPDAHTHVGAARRFHPPMHSCGLHSFQMTWITIFKSCLLHISDMVPCSRLLLQLAALCLIVATSASQQDGAVAEVPPIHKYKPHNPPSRLARWIRLLLCGLPFTSTSRSQAMSFTLQTLIR